MPPAPRLPARSERRSPRTLEKGNGGSSEPPAFKSIWHLRGDDRQDKTSAATAAKTRLERCRSSTRRRSSVTPATPTIPPVMIKLAAKAASCRRRSSTDFILRRRPRVKRGPITTKVSDGRGIAPSGLRDVAHHQRDGIWVPAFTNLLAFSHSLFRGDDKGLRGRR